MSKHKQAWNWTPKAYRWRDNLVSVAVWGAGLAVIALFIYRVWADWGNG
jgi:hypothetical protein